MCSVYRGGVVLSQPISLQYRPKYSVKCEAASTPISIQQSHKCLRLKMGSASIPHPEKVSYGGEDAFFVSNVGGGALGVSDGVGGWQESGVNPAEYSETFMSIAKEYLEGELQASGRAEAGPYPSPGNAVAFCSGEWMDASPNQSPTTSSFDEAVPRFFSSARTALEALREAHRLTKKPGSATACVLRMDPLTGSLDAANLGDSGFLIIRDGQVAFQSPPLQHFFDCPFQFGAVPEYLPESDTVDDAEVYKLPLAPGDAIILATDGVLDNIWPEEIAGLAPRRVEDVQTAANALAALAAERGADLEFESPYAVGAMEEGIDLPLWDKLTNISFVGGKLELGKIRGGKLDDVTVVVAVVEEAKPEGEIQVLQPSQLLVEDSTSQDY